MCMYLDSTKKIMVKILSFTRMKRAKTYNSAVALLQNLQITYAAFVYKYRRESVLWYARGESACHIGTIVVY